MAVEKAANPMAPNNPAFSPAKREETGNGQKILKTIQFCSSNKNPNKILKILIPKIICKNLPRRPRTPPTINPVIVPFPSSVFPRY